MTTLAIGDTVTHRAYDFLGKGKVVAIDRDDDRYTHRVDFGEVCMWFSAEELAKTSVGVKRIAPERPKYLSVQPANDNGVKR